MSRPLGPQAAKAYRQIRIGLANGAYLPGSQLPSQCELAHQCGVALLTVREALRQLTVEGLIMPLQGRGTFVAPELGAASWDTHAEITAILQSARQQTDYLRTIFQTAPIGILTADLAGMLDRSNGAMQELLGYTEAELCGIHWTAISHPDDIAQEERLDERLIAGEIDRYQIERRLRRKDGTVVWVRQTVAEVRDADNHALFAVGMFEDIDEQRRIADALKQSELHFRTSFELASVGMAMTTLDGRYLRVNRAGCLLFGYSEEQLCQRGFLDLTHPDDVERCAREVAAMSTGQRSAYTIEKRFIHRDGSTLWAKVDVALIVDTAGKPSHLMAHVQNITARKEEDLALRTRVRQHEVLAQLGAHALGAATLDAFFAEVVEAVGTTLNTRYTTVLECLPESNGLLVRATNGWRHPHEFGPSPISPAGYALAHGTTLVIDDLGQPEWAMVDFGRLPKRGIVGGAVVLIPGGSAPFGTLSCWRDDQRQFSDDDMHFLHSVAQLMGAVVTRDRMERALEHQALSDSLTGLPNRVLLRDRLQQAILTAQRERHPFALLLLDLDGFKDLNDAFGHSLGDALLEHVARRLCHPVRDTDTVARLGGDEFAVLLPGADQREAVAVAQRILEALDGAFNIDGRSIHIGGSIGAVLFPDHGWDAPTLLRRADVAMYAAKRVGAGYTLYATHQDEDSPDRLTLTSDLRHAIDNDELTLWYQPLIDLASGQIKGVEALARWTHAVRGAVSPGVFIPLAEQSNLIKPLTWSVLRQAVAQARAWRAQGLSLTMSINLSARNLHDPQLAPMLDALLGGDEQDIPCLTLEITESAIMEDPEAALATVTALQGMNMRVAIDDFGTGYSSLAYLKRLPVDEIKIDRSFVTDMASSRDSAFIVRSIIELGHNLGLETVAEGVEDQKTVDQLRVMGCDRVQGYFFSRPVPAGEVIAWQQEHRAG